MMSSATQLPILSDTHRVGGSRKNDKLNLPLGVKVRVVAAKLSLVLAGWTRYLDVMQ
jgi:hypothetical protein